MSFPSSQPRAPVLPKLLVIFLIALAADCWAEVVLDQGFDGPDTSWQLTKATNARLLGQRRTSLSGIDQQATVEHLVIATAAGYAANIRHPVERLPVLDELQIEVFQRSNRVGLQLAAEVVFPRTRDPKTAQPIRTLVFGDRYTTPDTWQQLKLTNIPQLARRRARLMSAGPQQQVDDREAYIDHVVLVVPGGPGESNVQIDRLLIQGVVAARQPRSVFEGPRLSPATGDGPLLSSPRAPTDAAIKKFQPVQIHRQGKTIMVEGNPVLPRAIEYRGESFESISRLGFNTVLFSATPSITQLQAAGQAKLWVICPPPPLEALPEIQLDSAWQTVLAWSMGLDNTALGLDQIASKSEAIRRDDPLGRPILVGASDRSRRFAQQVDVLVQPQDIPLAGKATANSEEQRLPILGCSPWSEVSIGWSSAARWQALALAPHGRHVGWHEPWRIRQSLLHCLATGSRGIVVRTHEKLGGTSPEAKRLENQLMMVNREISAIEPWMATGKVNQSGNIAAGDVPHVTWHMGRSRLVYLPATKAKPRLANSPPTLVIAGAAADSKASMLTSAGLVPLSGDHVTGGFQIRLSYHDSPRWVLVTDDRRLLASIERRLNRSAAKLSQLSRTLVMSDVMELEAVQGQLQEPPTNLSLNRIASIKKQMQRCDELLASAKYAAAMVLSQSLHDQTALERRKVFQKVTAAPGFQSIATMHELRLLPTHESLSPALFSLPRSGNLLGGGDFETLDSCRVAGWKHNNYADSHHECSVKFSQLAPQHGQACLRMTSQPRHPTLVEAGGEPPAVVWVTSPQMRMSRGTLIEITGWVRVVESSGSKGKLIIQDSLGGDELALRIPTTTGWQPIRIIRMADDSQQLSLQLAVAGSATADVDAMMVRTITLPDRTASRDSQRELE